MKEILELHFYGKFHLYCHQNMFIDELQRVALFVSEIGKTWVTWKDIPSPKQFLFCTASPELEKSTIGDGFLWGKPHLIHSGPTQGIKMSEGH